MLGHFCRKKEGHYQLSHCKLLWKSDNFVILFPNIEDNCSYCNVLGKVSQAMLTFNIWKSLQQWKLIIYLNRYMFLLWQTCNWSWNSVCCYHWNEGIYWTVLSCLIFQNAELSAVVRKECEWLSWVMCNTW